MSGELLVDEIKRGCKYRLISLRVLISMKQGGFLRLAKKIWCWPTGVGLLLRARRYRQYDRGN